MINSADQWRVDDSAVIIFKSGGKFLIIFDIQFWRDTQRCLDAFPDELRVRHDAFTRCKHPIRIRAYIPVYLCQMMQKLRIRPLSGIARWGCAIVIGWVAKCLSEQRKQLDGGRGRNELRDFIRPMDEREINVIWQRGECSLRDGRGWRVGLWRLWSVGVHRRLRGRLCLPGELDDLFCGETRLADDSLGKAMGRRWTYAG